MIWQIIFFNQTTKKLKMKTIIFLRTTGISEYLIQLDAITKMFNRPFGFILINEFQELLSDSENRQEIKQLRNLVNYRNLNTIVVYSVVAIFIGRRPLADFLIACKIANIKVFSLKEPGLSKLFDLDEFAFKNELALLLNNMKELSNEVAKIKYKPKTGITVVGYPSRNK